MPTTRDEPVVSDEALAAVLQKEVESGAILAEELAERRDEELAGRRRKEPNQTPAPAPYQELQRILVLAYNQSSTGKGAERHAASPVGVRPWHDQPILANARQVGPGGPGMQVMKKTQEAVTMAGNKNFTSAKAEALGAIVYAAALYKIVEEMEAAS